MAVIELDLYAPAEPAPARIPPTDQYRAAGLALVIAAVLALGGAARPVSVLWREAGTAPLSPTGTYQVIGGRLFTFEADGDQLTMTAWSMAPIRRRWTTTLPTTGTDDRADPLAGAGWYLRAVADDGALLQTGQTATVYDARTGAVRWRTSAWVVPVDGGRVGLIQDERFRPGTRYDENSNLEGPPYLGVNGVFHTEPPTHTELRALDLRTGRQLWTAGYPGMTVAVGAPDPESVLILGGGRLSLVAAGTGATLRERTLPGPPAPEMSYFPVAGDLVLFRQGGAGVDRTVTAYSGRTLAPVWQRDAPPDDGDNSFCEGMPCALDESGFAALDPATGTPRWHVSVGTTLIARAGAVLEKSNGENRPIRIRYPASGGTRIDLRQWEWFGWNATDDSLLLGRGARSGTVFAVLARGSDTVQPLGYSEPPVTQCQPDQHVVACRTNDGVKVWSYLS